VILCGGSALPPSATRALTSQFGVPVAQGYGLQETSPSTHCDSLRSPKLGSSGHPVAGTDCRIVDVDTRVVLPVGAKGEIQVRGPQLMMGYLGRELAHDVDPDGWFSTGDVGYVDPDGALFVTDRIKDVFKCDNWLVSPMEIEQVVLSHPAVADCVILDYPDKLSGSVVYALVVPRADDLDPPELAGFVASRLPYYAHLRHIELVSRIPRSPNGKVQRRALREQVHARREAQSITLSQNRRPPMFTFINRFTVTGDAVEFERLLGQITAHMIAQPGFRSHRLYQSAQNNSVYTEIAEWDSADAHKQATSGADFREPVREVMKHATADPSPFVLRSEHDIAVAK
ncbi:MAG TPA: AMP-binding protein, partial [Pseudonocardiaceae bacterium]|nr:AMP-binding protein [Pseudonocardiaceae bacterium]